MRRVKSTYIQSNRSNRVVLVFTFCKRVFFQFKVYRLTSAARECVVLNRAIFYSQENDLRLPSDLARTTGLLPNPMRHRKLNLTALLFKSFQTHTEKTAFWSGTQDSYFLSISLSHIISWEYCDIMNEISSSHRLFQSAAEIYLWKMYIFVLFTEDHLVYYFVKKCYRVSALLLITRFMI